MSKGQVVRDSEGQKKGRGEGVWDVVLVTAEDRACLFDVLRAATRLL